MFCTTCGAATPEGSVFCPNCGSNTATATGVACPACGHVSPAGSTFCAACRRPFGAGHRVYAGFWWRVLAYLIDGSIVSAASLFLLVPLSLLFATLSGAAWNTVKNDPSQMFGFMMFLPIVMLLAGGMQWLYFTLFESSKWQATPGKHVLGIQVTDMDGRRISFGRANGRFFGKILSGFLLLGYILAAFTERKQALHDILASTIVVRNL